MTKLTNEQIEQILEGAPEESTHYDVDGDGYTQITKLSTYDFVKGVKQAGGYLEPYWNLDDLREILSLRKEVEQLERENKDLNEDLIHTQKFLSQSEMALEDIQTSFCDDDACPLFEPFTVKNMWKWINSRSRPQTSLAEVRARAVEDSIPLISHLLTDKWGAEIVLKLQSIAAKIRNGKDGKR